MENIKIGDFLRCSGRIYKVTYEAINGALVAQEISKVHTCPVKYLGISKYDDNLAGVLEVGDYVNGHRIEEIIDGIDEKIITTDAGDLVKGLLDYEIKEILTKEVYERDVIEIKEV